MKADEHAWEALSPLDGRYRSQVEPYARAFCEEALMRQRFAVEVGWLLALAACPEVKELPQLEPATVEQLKTWVAKFGKQDMRRVKEIEARINHDVKAVEYYLKERLAAIGWGPEAELAHFACTSEDINNLAYSLMLREGLEAGFLPEATGLLEELAEMAVTYRALPMPSHTHGQPATPTTLGKELAVFVRRFDRQLQALRVARLLGKFNGAVGTYGAHVAAYPEVPWADVTKAFVEGLGFEWNPLTTQIEPHDSLAEVCHCLMRFNSVLLDFCRDMWEYVSRSYLRQRPVAGEVGSSTMPHKVNPIDFENAEANAGISSALLGHLASKLTVSRMQRDLSDSSALRNLGVALGHAGLAVRSVRRGLSRVEPDAEAMAAELGSRWEVLAEAIQTVMRRYGLPEPYERLKELTRGASVTQETVQAFVKGLGLPEEAEERLLALTPATYLGIAAELVDYARLPSGSSSATSATS